MPSGQSESRQTISILNTAMTDPLTLYDLVPLTWNDMPAYLEAHGLRVQSVRERGELEFVVWTEQVTDDGLGKIPY
jgi:hypothetical protein